MFITLYAYFSTLGSFHNVAHYSTYPEMHCRACSTLKNFVVAKEFLGVLSKFGSCDTALWFDEVRRALQGIEGLKRKVIDDLNVLGCIFKVVTAHLYVRVDC